MAIVPYSGFYGSNTGDYALLNNKSSAVNRVKRLVNRDDFRALRGLLDALIGAAAGGTALKTHTRVSHIGSGNSVGTLTTDLGKPTVLTVTDINRVTTAADVVDLKNMLVNVTERPVPYPVDRSGNGGPTLS